MKSKDKTEKTTSMPSYGNSETASGRLEERRCVYCGIVAPVVWVHGHGQCAACGINVEECCRGERCREKA